VPARSVVRPNGANTHQGTREIAQGEHEQPVTACAGAPPGSEPLPGGKSRAVGESSSRAFHFAAHFSACSRGFRPCSDRTSPEAPPMPERGAGSPRRQTRLISRAARKVFAFCATTKCRNLPMRNVVDSRRLTEVIESRPRYNFPVENAPRVMEVLGRAAGDRN